MTKTAIGIYMGVFFMKSKIVCLLTVSALSMGMLFTDCDSASSSDVPSTGQEEAKEAKYEFTEDPTLTD